MFCTKAFKHVWQMLVVLRRHYSAPISRRRLYIFLVRQDVMTAECLSQDFEGFMCQKMKAMNRAVRGMAVKHKWLLGQRGSRMFKLNLCAITY